MRGARMSSLMPLRTSTGALRAGRGRVAAGRVAESMWFKVDDKFHLGPKGRRLLRGNPAKRRDCHAGGLWLFAGCWCMNTESADGFIPSDELDAFDDEWERLATELVEADLWEVADDNGEKGYRFHDWPDWQPIFELKAKRAEAGRIGGLASAKKRAQGKQKQASATSKAKQVLKQTEASAVANGKQAEANRQANPTSSHPIPSQPKVLMAGLVSHLQVVGASGKNFTIDRKYADQIAELTGGDDDHVVAVSKFILDGAPGDVRSPGAYVLRSVKDDLALHRYHRRMPRKSEQCPEHAGEWADSCRPCAIDARLGDHE